MPFDPEDAKAFARLLRVGRLSLLDPDWEQRACELEALVALAAWRQQPVEFRLAALLEALEACPPEQTHVFKPWGSDDI